MMRQLVCVSVQPAYLRVCASVVSGWDPIVLALQGSDRIDRILGRKAGACLWTPLDIHAPERWWWCVWALEWVRVAH